MYALSQNYLSCVKRIVHESFLVIETIVLFPMPVWNVPSPFAVLPMINSPETGANNTVSAGPYPALK